MMFQRIRLRLVLWNASVFLAILATLGTVFMLDLRFRLYATLDGELRSQVQSVMPALVRGHVPALMMSGQSGSGAGRRPLQVMPISLILWSDKGERLSVQPEFITDKEEAQLRHLATLRKNGSIVASGASFRVLTMVITESGESANTFVVQVLRNTEDLTQLLRQSLRIVVAGIFLGALFSVLAGLLLASRALIPIRTAWDKQVQFVSDASHELRTPLAAIGANAELLLRSPEETISEKATTVSGILSETRRMNRLVNHLLTLARSDSNTTQIERRTVNLNQVIGDAVEHFRPLAESRSLRLTFECQEEKTPQITATVDPEQVSQLLFILLDNAVKFTSEGGSITVSLCKTGRKIEIIVSDTGCGILKADLPRIFDRFFRGEKSRSEAAQSAGLGLAIAKWIVEAHRGTITVHSKVGVGTIFTVLLPVR